MKICTQWLLTTNHLQLLIANHYTKDSKVYAIFIALKHTLDASEAVWK